MKDQFAEHINYINYVETTFENNSSGTFGSYSEMFRSATFIFLFSLLENEYYKLCAEIQEAVGMELGAHDLSGGGISRARTFIAKTTGHDPGGQSDWRILIAYLRIRNIKAHGATTIGEPAKLTDVLGIEWSDESRFTFKKAFLPSFIQFAELHLEQVTESVTKAVQERFRAK